jgi:hypothetical protein
LTRVVERTDVSAVLLSGTRVEKWQKDVEEELKKNIDTLRVPFMFGGELSEVHREKFESLGGYVLGSDHIKAMDKMESIIPAFGGK